MASRREFTFGSMVLALTGAQTARAGIPELEQGAPQKVAPPAVEGPPKLGFGFALSRTRKELHVAMTVTNRHAQAVELVAARGSMPGAYVEASIEIDGQHFELPVIYQGDRREMFSRAGPIPRYERVAAGASLELGTYRFQWPDGVPDLPVHLTGGVDVDTWFVEFDERRSVADPSAKAS